MEDMFWWGKTQSYEWFERVVDHFGVLLDNGEDIEIKVFVRVAAILKQYFDVESLAYSMLFEKYWSWFYVTYSEMDFFHGRNYSFR